MVWNKTKAETVNAILKDITETLLTYKELSEKYKVSECSICKIAKEVPKHIKKARATELTRRSKLGERNPMFAVSGTRHPRGRDEPILASNGYLYVFPPDWWTGTLVKGRVGVHHVVCCKSLGITELPKKCVVHHKDENKLNNSPDNLQLMSVSEHMRLHMTERMKVQRLSREGVGGSASEAPDTCHSVGDDIV